MRDVAGRLGLAALAACLGAARAHAGPPFLTDDPAPTPAGQYEIYTFANGAWGAGASEGAVGVDFNYGGAPDLQLTAALPFAFERPSGGEPLSGLGTLELAAKWRFLHQETAGVDVAVFPRLFIPSGTDVSGGRASLLLPVWVGRDWDGGSVFGGGGCAIHRGGGARDYCLAGLTVTRRFAPDLQVGAEVFHQSADEIGGRPSTVLGVGVTWDVSETLHVLAYGGAQMEYRDVNGDGLGYASMLFTF